MLRYGYVAMLPCISSVYICFLFVVRPAGLPYMLERAGLDVQQGK